MPKTKRMFSPKVLLPGVLFFLLTAQVGKPGWPTRHLQLNGCPPGSSGMAAEDLIEVHGAKAADVPTTAKYVAYDGSVRRILRFSEALTEGEECPCPRCCGGRCYVIIYTDPISPGGPLRVPYILWLEC